MGKQVITTQVHQDKERDEFIATLVHLALDL